MNEYYMQIIKDLRLFDDDFIKIVFKEDKQCAKEVINAIMSGNEEIEKLYVEDTIKNISGKDIRYDAITRKMAIALEVQRNKYEARSKRIRLYDALLASKSYERQKGTAVIFIIKDDYYGLARLLYHIQRREREEKLKRRLAPSN